MDYLKIPIKQFLPWLAAVVVITLAGYPGVICVTPIAWLITIPVGLLVVKRSGNPSRSGRLMEAAIGGGFLGLLQGLLFWILSPGLGPLDHDEALPAAILTGFIFLGGIFTGALLAVITGYLAEIRQE